MPYHLVPRGFPPEPSLAQAEELNNALWELDRAVGLALRRALAGEVDGVHALDEVRGRIQVLGRGESVSGSGRATRGADPHRRRHASAEPRCVEAPAWAGRRAPAIGLSRI
jgi:hypothetical protein